MSTIFISTLSNELNVSKQAITKYIKTLGLFDELEKRGNKYIVPEHIANEVREYYQEKFANETPMNANELAFLQEQIRLKDQQIEALQTALQQEQQLHAADKQQLLLLTAPKPKRSFFSFFRRAQEK